MATETHGTGSTRVVTSSASECSMHSLNAFPFAAWGDISGAKLDPNKVVEAQKVEIGYVEKKRPVWDKIPRWLAKTNVWKIIKSR